jgi:hypothetical protein
MEAEVQNDSTTEMNKVIWPNISLTQYDPCARTAGIMGTQLKTIHN